MATGVSALNAASARAAQAANRIVESQLEPADQAPEQPPSDIRPGPAPAPKPDFSSSDLERFDLIEGMVDLITAKTAYKAGAAIIRTQDEMMDETLKII